MTTNADRFESLVVPELAVLLRAAKSICHTTHDAEDLVQDTLLRAFRSIETFDGRYPRSWLLTIMRNAHINRHRRKRIRLLSAGESERINNTADPNSSTESLALSATFEEAVKRAVSDLPADFRLAVTLVDIQGLTYSDAAAMAGVPEGTIMSRVHRGRRRIRTKLSATDFHTSEGTE